LTARQRALQLRTIEFGQRIAEVFRIAPFEDARKSYVVGDFSTIAIRSYPWSMGVVGGGPEGATGIGIVGLHQAVDLGDEAFV
jgi:hypothetical protein